MASIPKVLVVSDRGRTSPLWGSSLTQPFSIILETNPARTVQRWAELLPDLVVLDIDSEATAISLITKLRDETRVPILLLSSICLDKFMLDAYRAGVDDYILKTIHPLLFHAKLRAWLRHSLNVPNDMLNVLKINNAKLIPAQQCILFANRDPIRLTKLELRLLYHLMLKPDCVVKTEELCQRMWGESGEGDVIKLKNVVYRLRRKIEADPTNPLCLITVAGVGYQFKEN